GTGMLQNPQKLQASFYNNILCLPAGHYLQLHIPTAKLTMKRWYWPQQQIKEASEQIFSPEKFLALLTTSVQQRLRSHVTVGASLSGGIDSAAIVALAAPHSPLTAYTAVFENFEKNEAQRAKKLLQHIPNTKGLEVAPTVADFHQYFSAFIHQQDEPVQSASAFVQYCVYKAAQQHGTTVLLDGQGADELLGGYTRHTQWYVALQAKQHVWQALQQGKQLYNNGFLPSWLNPSLLAGFFPNYTSQYLSKKALQQIQQVPIEPGFLHKHQNRSSIEKPVIQQWQQLLYYDTFINGLSTLLRYADRNSMAFGREVRLPFLQHQLVAYCLAMPNDVKIHQGFTKWILRKAVEPILPTGYGWQPGKIGYEPPQKQWMLHPTSQAMVAQAKEKLIAAQVLSPKALHQKWAAVSAHENDWNWRVLNAAAILP
ncbi:MAG: asparagine synthase, partial [Bacteroidetes bacterium]